MITRQQAQQWLLKEIDREIKERGEDYIYMCSPMPCKNSWTLAEYKKAVNNDECLENAHNPIDDVMQYEKYMQERGLKGLEDEL